MKNNKIDQRVRYTKLILKQTLIQLLKELSIAKISVKMLCGTANINRSTFYSHYDDQYDLLRDIEQEVIDEMKGSIALHIFNDNSSHIIQIMNQIYHYAAENADLFKVLLSNNCGSEFRRDIMLLAQDTITSDPVNTQPQDTQETHTRYSEYTLNFIITGGISILQKWLNDGLIESSQEMAEISSKLICYGMSGL